MTQAKKMFVVKASTMKLGATRAGEVDKCNYKEFRDIISFDATFRTNKYDMVFVPFTGIDNHRKRVTIGSGLLLREDTKAYTWLLTSFMTAHEKQPTMIVTNQDGEIIEAVWACQILECKTEKGCEIVKVRDKRASSYRTLNIEKEKEVVQQKGYVAEHKADEVDKCNYKEFRDIISFDATFRTNKYDMVFVPFTGIDNHIKEDTEAYTWLLRSFMTAHEKQPTMIVTDQDGVMKLAIQEVITESKHRLCMWHIMQRIPAKMTKMFNLQEMWLPTYFIDSPLFGWMRTTLRSESENAFFKSFTNHGSTLVNFMMCFESAMERKLHFEALEKGYNTTCIEKKQKQIWKKNETIEKLTNEANYVVDECLFLLSKDEEMLATFVEQLKTIKQEVQVQVPKPHSQKTSDVIEDIYAVEKPQQNDVNNPQQARNEGGRRGERRKNGKEIALKAKTKQIRRCLCCREKTNKHTKSTCPSNPKYVAKLARLVVAAAKQRTTTAAATEQATTTVTSAEQGATTAAATKEGTKTTIVYEKTTNAS
nr:hypothetical protein [Tanacetum cinerariifolium]